MDIIHERLQFIAKINFIEISMQIPLNAFDSAKTARAPHEINLSISRNKLNSH